MNGGGFFTFGYDIILLDFANGQLRGPGVSFAGIERLIESRLGRTGVGIAAADLPRLVVAEIDANGQIGADVFRITPADLPAELAGDLPFDHFRHAITHEADRRGSARRPCASASCR
mgnify:CR=1 FL=1